jgi:chloramphenicol-sensitive protein RarD
VLSLAVLMFGEHMPAATKVTFGFIWAGLIIYSVDAWLTTRRRA